MWLTIYVPFYITRVESVLTKAYVLLTLILTQHPEPNSDWQPVISDQRPVTIISRWVLTPDNGIVCLAVAHKKMWGAENWWGWNVGGGVVAATQPYIDQMGDVVDMGCLTLYPN